MTPEQAAEDFLEYLQEGLSGLGRQVSRTQFNDLIKQRLLEIIQAQRAEAVAEYLSNPIEQLKKDVVVAAIVWQTTWHDKGMKAAELLQGYLYDRVRHLVKAMNPPEQEGEG